MIELVTTYRGNCQNGTPELVEPVMQVEAD